MPSPRVRFTIRRMMVAVAVVAVVIFLGRELHRHHSGYYYDQWLDSEPLPGERNPYPQAVPVLAPARSQPTPVLRPEPVECR